MNPKNPFKWRHYQPEIILLCVRWYLRYPLSYRNVEEMMQERGLAVDHTTVYRWVQTYSVELKKRCRPHWHTVTKSWRVDETYIRVKGKWKYLYRAVDSKGHTIDFLLCAKRDKRAASRFLAKALKTTGNNSPRVINVDNNAAYPVAVEELKAENVLDKSCQLRQNKYLNNLVEQDHRFLKKLVNPSLGFKSFYTARRTIIGYEIMNMIRKGQLKNVPKGEVRGQIYFIAQIFQVAA